MPPAAKNTSRATLTRDRNRRIREALQPLTDYAAKIHGFADGPLMRHEPSEGRCRQCGNLGVRAMIKGCPYNPILLCPDCMIVGFYDGSRWLTFRKT